ncbi:hypothetical protein SEUCBS139899_003609 [Sporothrix eucalyptigena]|uniref:Zn(2)-C6 fungal-type domain-containing protein n=1 Tax=Sporothrix eucalyptigena TaxID=1812306 RepID=A0ABP0C8J0_9PEZI
MDGTTIRRAAKVGHRKSRNGCTKCKTRRVKCDEVRPVCSNCQRLGLECAWPHADGQPATSIAASSSTNSTSANHHLAPPSSSPTHLSPSSQGTTLHHAPFHTHHSQSNHSPASGHVSLSDFSAASTDFGENSSGTGHSPNEQDAQRFSAMLQIWSSNVEQEAGGGNSSDSAGGSSNGGGGAALLDGSGVAPGDTKSAIATDAENDCLLPESRARRLLEHRLMQNYLYNLGVPFPVAPSQDWTDLWTKRVPPMALQYDNVLYAIMSHSATHMLRKEPRNHSLFRARQAYLIAAMRVQRRMIDTLTLDSADAVCLASLIMLVQSFAMLDERIVDPYTPPMDWLRLGKGAGAVIWMSVEAILKTGEESKSIMLSIANSQPRMGFDESYFDASNREQLNNILAQDLPASDDWDDADTRDAYEKTLSYVGSLQQSMRRGEPIYVLCRRVQGFTMVIPPRFVDFVAERRPRALVILAHFFAAVSKITHAGGVWWMGGEDGKEPIATREVRGIHSIMPKEWMGHMIWPMEAAGLS